MPPWAAPKMNWPFFRIASAPMRPLTGTRALSLRAICWIGLGPMAFQVPAKVAAPVGVAAFKTCAFSAAVLRSAPAFSRLSWC